MSREEQQLTRERPQEDTQNRAYDCAGSRAAAYRLVEVLLEQHRRAGVNVCPGAVRRAAAVVGAGGRARPGAAAGDLSAYTLYTVEGSRDGRKWFGLRLGFFSDAISAKQVAHYVRSEFTSVAVVPVSPQEKARATDQDKLAATLNNTALARRPRGRVQADRRRHREGGGGQDAGRCGRRRAGGRQRRRRQEDSRATRAAGRRRSRRDPGQSAPGSGRRAGRRPRAPRREDGRQGRRPRQAPRPESLEETLEILGASQLTIDDGTRETLNESGVRHLRVEVHKNSPFSKLLERLSERMKKS